ncbi:MAG: EamA family transporter [Candidatus Omnitrophica bacterium]|nr:EamA family transporter [Candidatus Omnitrophota bacterium]
MDLSHTIIGCTAALISAAAWAFDPILFKKLGEKVLPAAMNLGRALVGMVYLLLLVSFIGIETMPAKSLLYLGVSGILGIALGDTFFLMGLVRLGPRLAVLMETLCPVMTVLLAVVFLGERPSLPVWTGIVLTIGGVQWVLWERTPREKLKHNWLAGIKFGALSVTCTSVGIIFAKIGLVEASPVEATMVKLFFGSIGLLIWGFAGLRIKKWIAPFRENPRLAFNLSYAVFVAIGIGLLFSVIALKYANATIAVPLNSTSPLFVLPLVAFFFREKVSLRAVLGAAVAVAGIILIFLYS